MHSGQVCLIPTACRGWQGLVTSWRLADLHLPGPPLVVALGLQCFLYAGITTIQVHVSLFLYFLWIHLPQGLWIDYTIFLFCFILNLQEILIHLFFYDCSVFTALYFSFLFFFFLRTQNIMHICYFFEKKGRFAYNWNNFFSSISLLCNPYLEFLFLGLLTPFIIKISKFIRNMQWMVIYIHDKENKIGRETVQHVLQLFFFFFLPLTHLLQPWSISGDISKTTLPSDIFKFEYSR